MKQRLCSFFAALALCLSLGTVFAAAEYDPAHTPMAESAEIETYRDTSVGGTLSATDPDGDAVTFRLATEPMKGSVTIEEDGTFTYTPEEGKRGKDYFGFQAVDADGNESAEATVLIRIRKQKTDTTYADMAGNPAGYAAVWLAEQGAFAGERIADAQLFRPEADVSRGEFLALAQTLAGTSVLQGVIATGFGDDAAIPAWAKDYVSTARMDGTVQGSVRGGKMVFSADRAITHAEAAVMLDRMLAPQPAAAIDEAVPAWAAQAMANLANFELYADSNAAATLTRAECAKLLLEAFGK